MRSSIAVLFMHSAAFVTGACQVVPVASAPTLQVTIQSGKESVKAGDIFPVTTVIQNVGQDVQTLHLWICSYEDHWISDNPNAHVLETLCEKNFIQAVKLKPGQSHKRDLNLRADMAPKNPPRETPSAKSLRFRLGFTDGDKAESNKVSKPIWSNSIALKIAE